jgi:hypothetical protein
MIRGLRLSGEIQFPLSPANRQSTARSGCLVTHSFMELSPSWEAANCAATQQLPSVL